MVEVLADWPVRWTTEDFWSRSTKLASSPWSNFSLQWRHNGRDGVSNHQCLGCLLNRLFRRRSKKTSKLRVTGLCDGNRPVTGEFPHKGPVYTKMFPFVDVIMAFATFCSYSNLPWNVTDAVPVLLIRNVITPMPWGRFVVRKGWSRNEARSTHGLPYYGRFIDVLNTIELHTVGHVIFGNATMWIAFVVNRFYYICARVSGLGGHRIRAGRCITHDNGNIFRIIGPLWGEFIGHLWIPLTKASNAELWSYFWAAPEQVFEQTIETPSRSLWRHCNTTTIWRSWRRHDIETFSALLVLCDGTGLLWGMEMPPLQFSHCHLHTTLHEVAIWC